VLQISLARIECEEPAVRGGLCLQWRVGSRGYLKSGREDAWDIIEVKICHGGQRREPDRPRIPSLRLQRRWLNIRRCFVMHVDRNYVPAVARSIPRSSSDRELLQGSVGPQPGNRAATGGHVRHHPSQTGSRRSRAAPTALIRNVPADGKMLGLPAADSVFTFITAARMLASTSGRCRHLKDIPEDVDLTKRQTIQREVANSGKPHIDAKALARFLKPTEIPGQLPRF